MAMTHTGTKGEGQSTLGSKVRLATDGRTEATALGLLPVLLRWVTNDQAWIPEPSLACR